MYRLECNVQKYGWGRIGNESKVAVYKSAQDSQFKIEDTQTYAEMWMGTHSNCPSKIQFNDTSILLKDFLLQRGTKSLGTKISKHFYENNDTLKQGDLPFLFKVLSINQALSIQAHPNKELARVLHERDPKNYPDANHKPEMLIAISETFEAMCGFRLASEIITHFNKYSELAELCDQKNCNDFVQNPTEETLRKCFYALMSKDDTIVKEKFQQLKIQLESSSTNNYLDSLFLRLAVQYPNDVGCFSIYLFNCIKLKKGEAIFLSANVPHAYLFGDGVECMATSDNVVRAGLTPKFKDVNVLCEMLDYSMRSANDNILTSTKTDLSNNKDYLLEYRPPINEFSVQQIRIEKHHVLKNNKLLIPKCESGSILIINEINLSETQLKAHFCLENGEKFDKIRAGFVYFIDALTDVYFVIEELDENLDNHSLILLGYRAYCDIKE